MITLSSFRSDFSEFSDQTKFPDSTITYWLSIATLLINQDMFGLPAPFVEQNAVLAGGGAGYAVDDVLSLDGGTFTQPALIKVTGVDANGAITAFAVTNGGQYTGVPQSPVATTNTTGAGAGATFTMTWVSGPLTECDYAIELLTAHNVVLERRAMDEAANGANPGQAQGAISSKSVGPVSVSYDTAIAAVENAGDLNLTIYGQRLAKLTQAFGMTVLTIIGNQNNGAMAWNGMIFAQGTTWDG